MITGNARLNFNSADEIIRVFEVVGKDYPFVFHARRVEAASEKKRSVSAMESMR
jgi:hypothetical protein